MKFVCPEFGGCEANHCAYEGEEDCHWRNVPVVGCGCQDCREQRRAVLSADKDTKI